MNENLNEEQKKDVDTRMAEFLKRHDANMKELEFGFSCVPMPMIIADGIWATKIQMIPIDTKYSSKPSPFANDKVLK